MNAKDKALIKATEFTINAHKEAKPFTRLNMDSLKEVKKEYKPSFTNAPIQEPSAEQIAEAMNKFYTRSRYID